MIIPAIELQGGQVVSIRQDGEVCASAQNPVALARQLYRLGEITVIDLDASQGVGDNTELVREICRVAECRVGGGIRDAQRADRLLRGGAKQIIVGTTADESFLTAFPRRKVIVAIDILEGKVTRRDGQETTELDPLDVARRFHDYCDTFMYTLVGHRDRMEGEDLRRFEALRSALPDRGLIAFGQFTSSDDIRELDRLGVDCQVSYSEDKAALDFAEALAEVIDFETGGGLVPVVVQDLAGQVLSLVYANREAVLKSVRSGKATYWSRARKELWTKGGTSGSTQELVTVRLDTVRKALLFRVNASGPASALGRYSIFDEMDFSLHRLEQVMRQRQEKTDTRASYTQVMLANRLGLNEKIKEETDALIAAESRDEVLWESADLLYFMLLNLVREGITLDEVIKELRGRAGRRRS